MSHDLMDRPDRRSRSTTRILICGVGGQGTITAARALAETAIAEGLPVVASEVHGMSQRGGSVESSVLIGQARSPVIADGTADLVLALEPLEALRYAQRLRPGGTMVVNSAIIVPFTVSVGDLHYPTLHEVLDRLRTRAGRVVSVDAHGIAAGQGSPRSANIVMLGAASGVNAFPFSADSLRGTLCRLLRAMDPATVDRVFEAGERAASFDSAQKVA